MESGNSGFLLLILAFMGLYPAQHKDSAKF